MAELFASEALLSDGLRVFAKQCERFIVPSAYKKIRMDAASVGSVVAAVLVWTSIPTSLSWWNLSYQISFGHGRPAQVENLYTAEIKIHNEGRLGDEREEMITQFWVAWREPDGKTGTDFVPEDVWKTLKIRGPIEVVTVGDTVYPRRSIHGSLVATSVLLLIELFVLLCCCRYWLRNYGELGS